MKLFKAIVSVALTLILIWALQTKFGSLPPIGKFLNPCNGFWYNAESKHILPNENLNIPGLKKPVLIKYDERMVPHIFAQNNHDLYLAQGYVTARDRLWQLDIQTRSASGRLSEVVGPKALDKDRYQRRSGMVYGAERTVAEMAKDPQTADVVNAYTEGINSYIRTLTPRDYPIEFKLLDYAPEEWKPIDCAFLLKLMTQNLAGGSQSFAMTNTLEAYGAEVMKELFPDHEFRENPVIPAATPWDFKPVAIPKPSHHFIAQQSNIKPPEKVDGIGSNNWVVAGSKTANGYPILANDPHLHLSLPAIWYRIQLSAPGVNVNGVSIPGAPNVIIGYNNNVSWGFTNVDADVLDWYQIKFKDASKNEYWYNNRWNKTTRRIEEIKVRGQKTVYDTVIYTHHGPVVFDNIKQRPEQANDVPVGAAMRWIGHDAGNELKTFILLNRAKNYADYRKALTYYAAPAQNFVFASIDKDIALSPNGRFPLKYPDQGKYILDGTDDADDWHGYIPADQNPIARNPAQGYLVSANQSSVAASYPYYINWQQTNYERAERLNTRLNSMTHVTVDSMRMLQTDNYSIMARDILPTFIAMTDASKLKGDQLKAFNLVSKWNKRYNADEVGATVFNFWWKYFYQFTWNDEFAKKGTNYATPSRTKTLELVLKDPNSKWFDDKNTPAKENCADMVRKALAEAVSQLHKKFGPMGDKWQWGLVKETAVNHMGNIPGMGSGIFKAGGWHNIVNALGDDHGPSWRMVVQVGPQVEGYGIYPGGQSGNPGSYYYDDMLQTWRDGKLDKLLFMQSANDAPSKIKSTITLKAK
ncbi:penicillin acylase family protein [Mucilaginibacter ginkgonis]|uniref:Penicillin acylase family protein n=1 Tax=Mucilaginibacter ginkgonis TaxID=2682091 RepID=A0A6I4HZD6_9SPHI|nr:penicillin acylase family protein [Mucilaginibacter ginkgonis]QQL48632.1 penicillin acylase family protein [Mucilaginibacter ginkgonis]